MGCGKQIDVKIDQGRVQVRDYGRGIPLGKVVECVSVINTGAKYNDDVFQFSVGLNGVGTKAVNALSAHFVVRSYRDGRCAEVLFERGELKKQKKSRAPNEPRRHVRRVFARSRHLWRIRLHHEFVERRLWNYACLNRGLRLYFNRQKFESKQGLLDLLKSEAGDSVLYPPAYHKGQYLEFAFTHVDSYGESYRSFVNGQYTADGGTHQSAFREGVLKGVNEFYKKNFNGVDVRDGAFGVVAVKVKEPVF